MRTFVTPCPSTGPVRQNLPLPHLRQTDKPNPADPLPRRQAHGFGDDLVRGLPISVDTQFRSGVALGEGGDVNRGQTTV